MKNNNWKEKEPLPCEICKCCKTDHFEGTIMCCKYEATFNYRLGYLGLTEC